MPNPNLREFYDHYIAALNGRDFDVMKDFIHDEVTLNGTPATRDDILAVQRDEVGSVPDLHWVLTNLIIDGDRLGAQLINTGTPAKKFVGAEPTGPRSRSSSMRFTRSSAAGSNIWRQSTTLKK